MESQQTLPKVTLLVAMHNETGYIGKCLQSILVQDYPEDRLEVLIMDGNSHDNSCEITEAMIKGKNHCRLLTNPKITQAAGWNLGISHASGDIIGIVSGHAELEPNYVSKAVETLQRTKADMVGGCIRARGREGVGYAVQLATSTPFGVGGARFHYTTQEEEVDTVYMGLCRKEVYKRIGGFDEEMVRNQDDELSYRLREHGGRIICNPQIRSDYYNRGTFRSLWRQYFEYGYWKVRVAQKHAKQMQLRHFIPAAFVSTLLMAGLFSFFSPLWRVVFVPTALLYIVANLTVSTWTAARKSDETLLLYLPLTFAILHISYGLGFLKGIVNFLILKRRTI